MATTDFNWQHAIRAFWESRDAQSKKQHDSGNVDAGTRGSVTGGKHLDALADAVADLFRQGSELPLEVHVGGRKRLPGYYRPTKDWDLVVTYEDALVAAIEFKSQVGSFGNNFNNRTEEAIGNAVDLRRAYDAGLLGPIRPWLGFVMVLEKADASTKPLGDPTALFPTDPEFDETSYLDRYQILLQRLVADGLYDAVVLTSTAKVNGFFDEPIPDLSFGHFTDEMRSQLSKLAQTS